MLLPDVGNICLHYSIINEKSHLAGEKAGGRSLAVQVDAQELGGWPGGAGRVLKAGCLVLVGLVMARAGAAAESWRLQLLLWRCQGS